MIISKTPFRISLLGGGTDFPSYYKKYSGCVIGGTIDKFCYVSVRVMPDVFKFKHRIVWSKNETVNQNNEIIHPTVRSIFNYLKIKNGLEVHYQGDLQKNSGLGTSSSFCVGLLKSIYTLNKITKTKKKIALEAIKIEHNIMKENSGSQDQVWASYGGFNFIKFNNKNVFEVKNLKIKREKIDDLNSNLILIYTGLHRFSNNVEKDKLKNLEKNIKYLDKIKNLTLNLKKELLDNKKNENIGGFLNEYWELKKKLSLKVTNSKINEIYEEALKSGATGGKLIGSGGGGYLLVYCKKKFLSKLKKRLRKLSIINFNFTNEGSKIIFNS